jgi:hypothetical protein
MNDFEINLSKSVDDYLIQDASNRFHGQWFQNDWSKVRQYFDGLIGQFTGGQEAYVHQIGQTAIVAFEDLTVLDTLFQ